MVGRRAQAIGKALSLQRILAVLALFHWDILQKREIARCSPCRATSTNQAVRPSEYSAEALHADLSSPRRSS
jgi:hypothetical protein